jgi:hypothetical protein
VRFFRRHDDELGRQISDQRAKPSDELVSRLADAVKPSPRRVVRVRSGAAIALTALVLSVMAAFGGVSHATGAAGHMFTSISNVISPPATAPTGGAANAATGQYCPGDTDHDFENGTNSNGTADPDNDGDTDHCK